MELDKKTSVLIILVFVFFSNFFGDYFTHKWAIAGLIGILFVSIHLWKNYGKTESIAFTYLAGMSWLLASVPQFYPRDVFVLPLAFSSIRTLWTLMLFVAGVMFFRPSVKTWDILAWFGLGCAVVTIISQFLDLPIIGPGANLSVNCTLLSLFLPFTITNKNLIATVFILVAMIISHATSGLMAAGFVGITYMFLTRNWKIFFAMAFIFILALFVTGSRALFSDSHRLNCWKVALMYWMDNFNGIVGSGPGSFKAIFPAYQKTSNQIGAGYFIWLHSDWLQAYLETGILGLISMLALVIKLLKRCYTTGLECELLFLVAFSANMLTNFPMHMAPDMLLLCLVMASIYNKTRERFICKQQSTFLDG
jgi:hypothetical protein